MHLIFVINPGSTSTKIALFQNRDEIWRECIFYKSEVIAQYPNIIDQLSMRQQDIMSVLSKKNLNIESLTAISVRGGPFKPLESGTYHINEKLIKDIQHNCVQFQHASNLGALIGYEWSGKYEIPAFFTDPVCVDEMEPLARISGLPELKRKSLLHALNMRAVAYEAAEQLNRKLSSLNFVIAHLGGGISICAMKKGRIIDVNNAVEEGPFSPERAGSLPESSLVKWIFDDKISFHEIRRKIVGQGGLTAYLGTNDAREVENRISKGDKKAALIYEAMAYQIAKEIGAMAAVLEYELDAVLLTGSLSHSDILTGWIRQRIEKLGSIILYPGEREMKALASGTLRVLNGEEKAKTYS